MLALATFYRGSEDDMQFFAYKLFDQDGSLEVDRKELVEVLESLYVNRKKTLQSAWEESKPNAGGRLNKKAQKLINQIDDNASATIDLQEFKRLVHSYPNVMAPAYEPSHVYWCREAPTHIGY